MGGWASRLVLLFFAGWGTLAVAAEQPTQSCELHIWPTSAINAVDKDNWVASTGSGLDIGYSLTTVESVSESLAAAIPPSEQIDAIRSSTLQEFAPLDRYRLTFHREPVEGEHYDRKWLDKTVGHGTRHADSRSPCYTELHVVFITFLDQPMKDITQTIFLLRYFGAADATTDVAVDGGGYGTPGFVWSAEPQSADTKAAIKTAFQENLKKFLQRRKTKRLLQKMAQ